MTVTPLLNSDLISLLADCWTTSAWNINIPQANGTILPDKEMWLCKENGEKMHTANKVRKCALAIYTPTWRDPNVNPYPDETQIWVLQAFGAEGTIVTSQIPECFFFPSAHSLWRHRKEENLCCLAAELLFLLWTNPQTTSFNGFPVMMWANMWSLI